MEGAAKRSVLVVENTVAYIALVRDTLATVAPDVEVEVAADGAEALLRVLDGSPPDLVLVNRHLPRVDGLKMLQALESHPVPSRVVLWSTLWAPREADTVRASGVASCVQKPATSGALGDLLSSLLN